MPSRTAVGVPREAKTTDSTPSPGVISGTITEASTRGVVSRNVKSFGGWPHALVHLGREGPTLGLRISWRYVALPGFSAAPTHVFSEEWDAPSPPPPSPISDRDVQLDDPRFCLCQRRKLERLYWGCIELGIGSLRVRGCEVSRSLCVGQSANDTCGLTPS